MKILRMMLGWIARLFQLFFADGRIIVQPVITEPEPAPSKAKVIPLPMTPVVESRARKNGNKHRRQPKCYKTTRQLAIQSRRHERKTRKHQTRKLQLRHNAAKEQKFRIAA